jgi:glycerate 2-kinase
MRVVVAPDKFAGTLSSTQAAAAIAAGWSRVAPDDEVVQVPVADGGPGFVEVVHAARGGDLISVQVTGPRGTLVPGALLLGSDARVEGFAPAALAAWVECAQACGLHLIRPMDRDPGTTTTFGVGELLIAAMEAGATRIYVGLGGSGTNDAGAGLLAALGAQPAGELSGGGLALRELRSLDLSAARARVAGVDLVVATDVDSPLLGDEGATWGYAAQKGANANQQQQLEEALTHLARLIDDTDPTTPGAGAAGGLGFALLALGARRVSGTRSVLDWIDLDHQIKAADLVITGEGRLDWQSLRGKLVSGIAELTVKASRPCIVVAGQIDVGRQELAAAGIEAAYAVSEQAGSVEEAMRDPGTHLAAAAEAAARAWPRG